MRAHEMAPTTPRPPPKAQFVGARSEPDGLGATCRFRKQLTDELDEAISLLRHRPAALITGDAELRAENERIRSGRRAVDAGDARVVVRQGMRDIRRGAQPQGPAGPPNFGARRAGERR